MPELPDVAVYIERLSALFRRQILEGTSKTESGNHARLVPDVLGDGWAPDSALARRGSRCARGFVCLLYGVLSTASHRHQRGGRRSPCSSPE
jgi:hypothetical protein